MKKKLAILLVGTMIASSILAGCGSKKSEPTKKETSGELKGDITFWHSFTQGPRMEVIQQTADQFMKDNPGVKIKIETFSWGDFYTKWTTGLASGNVPDMSTALPGHVVEMMDADALEPVDDLIDDIGRNKFSKTALSEGKKDGTCYSLPLYSHAQVMWYRKDLLQKAGLSVPKTWDEFAEAAKTLTKDGVYGCSFPCGSNDLMATRFLNFYVRSGGGSLLTDDLKANLTSDLAIDGINYWLDIYKTLILKGWGLIDGKLIAIDGTKIRAQNSKHNCITKSGLDKKIAYADEQINAYLMALEKDSQCEPEFKKKLEDYQELKKQYHQQKQALSNEGLEQKSLTDPDSRRMKNNGSLDICYNVQSAVDAQNHFVIDISTTNDINDQNQLYIMAKDASDLLETEECTVVADTGYYNASEIKNCLDDGMTVLIKKAKAINSTKDNEFRKDKFKYDPEKDVYICPAEQQLYFFENTSKNGMKYK